jgi:hypothetical protein
MRWGIPVRRERAESYERGMRGLSSLAPSVDEGKLLEEI